jgi:hypothetical protein
MDLKRDGIWQCGLISIYFDSLELPKFSIPVAAFPFRILLRTTLWLVPVLLRQRALLITRSSGKNYSSTFLDTTWATLKIALPTILLLLREYSLLL